MRCKRCFKNLQVCQACNGRCGGSTGRTCNKCRNTGMACPTHDGHWK